MSDRSRPTHRYVASGEALAWRADMLGLQRHHAHPEGRPEGRPEAMFWLFGPPPLENEEIDGVTVVHVRGPLEHHADCYVAPDGSRTHFVESYDRIRECVAKGFESSKAVVLCIDSPGGVVSGLNECVADLQRMRRAAGIPLIAYANEMATSAALAVACACDEIWLPRSGIIGSVGVISTMVSVVGNDEKNGVRVVTITSGKRKADGHPHVPITDDAVEAEQERVDALAGQFYRLVSKSRELPVDEIEGWEAGLFLGKGAVKAGLADGVSGWSGFLATLAA